MKYLPSGHVSTHLPSPDESRKYSILHTSHLRPWSLHFKQLSGHGKQSPWIVFAWYVPKGQLRWHWPECKNRSSTLFNDFLGHSIQSLGPPPMQVLHVVWHGLHLSILEYSSDLHAATQRLFSSTVVSSTAPCMHFVQLLAVPKHFSHRSWHISQRWSPPSSSLTFILNMPERKSMQSLVHSLKDNGTN